MRHQRKPKIGRPRGSGHGGETVCLRLWPDHLESVAAWTIQNNCTRSEAVRQMIRFATFHKS